VNLWEQVVSMVGYHPYRCLSCQGRFLSLGHLAPVPVAPSKRGVEKEISATRSAMRWKQKRRDFLLYGSALVVFAFILYLLTREPSMGN
jgi:hypothetical protein